MKTVAIKRSTYLIFLATTSLFLMVASCEKNDTIEDLVSKNFLKFSDFGCENNNWHLKTGYNNTYYIVSLQEELINYIDSDCIPIIDFDTYFVIIGSKSFTSGASLYEEKVEENNIEIIYTITFLKEISTVALGVTYQAVIKKPINKKEVKVIEIIKDQI